MPNPHAHHILFKKGIGAKQQALVDEGQEILRSVGIDPVDGIENLIWAPNIKGQHTIGNLREVVDAIKDAAPFGKQAVTDTLRKLGDVAASRR